MKSIITASFVAAALAIWPASSEAQMFFQGGGNNNALYVPTPFGATLAPDQTFGTVSPSYNRFRIVTPRRTQFPTTTSSGVPVVSYPAPNYYDNSAFYGNNYNYVPRYDHRYQWYWR